MQDIMRSRCFGPLLAFRLSIRKGIRRIDDLATDHGHERFNLCDAIERKLEIVLTENREVRQHSRHQPATPAFIMGKPDTPPGVDPKRLFPAWNFLDPAGRDGLAGS